MFGLLSWSPAIPATPPSSFSSIYGRNWMASSLPLHPPASKIFVRNLSYHTSEATLIKTFSKFGQIVEVKLAKHEDTKRSKGYAFIQYSYQDDAVLAIEQMDQQILDGRVIYAEIAKPLHGGFSAYPKPSGPPPKQASEANETNV
ncbi:cold-inducible RNA-binding protein [Dioscorea alata]|uniref:Cold-inducible RNA-binding protein n=1 Tax=Dioscorea alata TaxID=55571 RepID=A0ACB7U2N8_DIOAL|nr:cold-inducible RNA-binding protein [Dioscorea alata]